MHILMDKGLRKETFWSDGGPAQSKSTFAGRDDGAEHLTFWRRNYPKTDVQVYTLPLEYKGDMEFWSALSIVDHTPVSQYDMLRQQWLAQASDLGPVAWLALTGDGFHGQRQRTWTALPGNLHLSLGIQPNLAASEYSYAMTMLPAVCLMDILGSWGLEKSTVGIKWVNDVLVGREKLAGVLTSARTDKGIITGSVLGFGMNILQAPVLPRSSFVQGCTCLHDHLGTDTPLLGDIVFSLLHAVAARLRQLQQHGPVPLFSAYKEHSLILGQKVEIWPEETGGYVEDISGTKPLGLGIVQSINSDLGLTLAGQDEPVTRGRLVWQHDDAEQKREP